MNLTLEACSLHRKFGVRSVIQDVDLQLNRGEILGLLGSNGAGKSTLLRMLTGNLAPSSGHIAVCGIDLLKHPQQAKRHLGYLPDIPPLYTEMTVDAYLLLVARLHRMHETQLPRLLDDVKLRCGLSNQGARLIKTLSKGYQQRLGIAQAIIHRPDVIILDEPTVGLDPNQMREVRQLIRELATTSSIVISTHILYEVENICDRVQILHQGQTVFNQSMQQLREQSIELDGVFTKLTQQ